MLTQLSFFRPKIQHSSLSLFAMGKRVSLRQVFHGLPLMSVLLPESDALDMSSTKISSLGLDVVLSLLQKCG